MRWRKRHPVQYDVTYKGEPFPPPPLEECTPLQYFKQFFDDSLIDHLVEQTNLYSVQSTGSSIGVTHNEMEMYLGLLVMMSIIKLPQIRMYWSKETRVPSVADAMAINRLEKIKQIFIVMTTRNISQLRARTMTNCIRHDLSLSLWWKNAGRYLKRTTTLWMSKSSQPRAAQV